MQSREVIEVDGQVFTEVPESIGEGTVPVEQKVYSMSDEMLRMQIGKRVDKINKEETLFKFAKKVMKHLDRRFEHNIDLEKIKKIIIEMFMDKSLRVNDAFKVIK